MKLSQPVASISNHKISGEVLEKLILHGDLSKLSPIEKVQYVMGLCNSIGLNPLTQPLKIMKFPDSPKEILYAGKDCTEQLRKNHRVSITNVETRVHEGIGAYIAIASAMMSDGRQDNSTAVVSIAGLKGNQLANAMMKCETKAKRRVTLSICGLGILDESEMDTIPGAKEVNITPNSPEFEGIKLVEQSPIEEDLEIQFHALLIDIENCSSIEELKQLFTNIKSSPVRRNPDYIDQLTEAKDRKKDELLMSDFTFDRETGEAK